MSGAGGMGGTIGPNACSSDPGDLEVIQMTTPNLRYQAAFCGTIDCSDRLPNKAPFIDCVSLCVQRKAQPTDQLSSNCANCYGELAWCAGLLCNTLCANTTPVPAICGNLACLGGLSGGECANYSTCLEELNQCAGRDSLDCGD
jgi:hypothetical protein